MSRLTGLLSIRRALYVLLPVVGLVLGGLTGGLLAPAPSYMASATVVVPAGTTPTDPGRASEAIRLAATLARLVPDDSALIAAVAADLQEEPAAVRRAIGAAVVPESSIIRVTYTDGSSNSAMAGVRALVAALAPSPATPAIQPGSLVVSELPSAKRRGDGPVNPGVGAALGALVGVFGALLLRRLDPVVNSADDLAPLPVPAVELRAHGPLLAALADRWTEEKRAGVPVPVLTLGLKRDTSRALERVLNEAAGPSSFVTVPYEAAPVGSDALARASSSVLFVRRGVRLAELERARTVTVRLGAPAQWIVLVAGGVIPVLRRGSGTAAPAPAPAESGSHA